MDNVQNVVRGRQDDCPHYYITLDCDFNLYFDVQSGREDYKNRKELKKKAKSRGIHIPPNQARGIMFMKAMSIVVIVINTGIFLVLSYAFIEEWNKL